MKTKILFLLFLFGFSVLSFGQTDTLNQLDAKGKKHGKWAVYLDDNWKELKDNNLALYSRYTYYDHGTNIYPMGACGKKGWKLESAKEVVQQNAKLKLLDGEYKWYDEKGRISSIHHFKNGEYVSCKEYYSSGELNQHFDYTKKCAGQPHGWSVSVYDKQGKLKLESFTCKDKDGRWPLMRG